MMHAPRLLHTPLLRAHAFRLLTVSHSQYALAGVCAAATPEKDLREGGNKETDDVLAGQ